MTDILRKLYTAREKVRAILEPKISTMLEEINLVFDQARLAVKKHKSGPANQPCSDLVIILDNLERIRKIGGVEEGLASQRELFLERYTQLTGMRAHFIYTVPLRLIRSSDQRIPNGDGDYLKMLENLSVLEYVNGGDADPFAEAEPWYAVNPIVRELQKFKDAAKTVNETITS
jgi:hypothetical protein